MSNVICVIPARMASTRFPGKPLKKILGLSIIGHIYKRCALSKSLDQVVVATCDKEIADEIESLGGKAVMTADTHERCTDRVEEAITKLDLRLSDNDFVLMVQGDEILINDDMIDKMIACFKNDGEDVVNLLSHLPKSEADDKNNVKAVISNNGHVLYMSREAIPSTKLHNNDIYFQQTGVIGFTKRRLHEFSRLEQTRLEKIESCDMMRFIENEVSIKAVVVERETIGVDTEYDLKRASEILNNDPKIKEYL